MQSGFAKWLNNHAGLRKLGSFRQVRSLTVAVRKGLAVRSLTVAVLKGLPVRSLAVAALKAFELAEGALVIALEGVDAALEAAELVGGIFEDRAEWRVLAGERRVLHFKSPQFGLCAGEAAELPVRADEDVDEAALFGHGRLKSCVILHGEVVETKAVFAGNDFGMSVDAGLQGVHGRTGLAFPGARTSGLLSVATIRLDLADSGHRMKNLLLEVRGRRGEEAMRQERNRLKENGMAFCGD